MGNALHGVTREASCQGKERFPNGAKAYRINRRRERRRGKIEAIPGTVYHCRFCGGYHIGTPRDTTRPKEDA